MILVGPAEAAAEESDPAPAGKLDRFERREWAIHIAPAFDYMTFDNAGVDLKILGGGLRVGGHKSLQKGGFFISGGPILHYTYLTEADKVGTPDKLHIITVNADMLLGGGGKKVLGYFHATFGLGGLVGQDGDTNTSIATIGVRAAAGAGLHGYITERFSMGTIFDVGWSGFGLWLNPMLVFNIHFPVVTKAK